MIELGHVTDRKPRFGTRLTRALGFPRPTLRGSSTTGATCRTSTSHAPSTTGTSAASRSVRSTSRCARRRSSTAPARVRRSARGVRARRADRHDEHHLRPRRLPDRRRRRRLLMATSNATLVCIALDERKAVPVPDAFRERIERSSMSRRIERSRILDRASRRRRDGARSRRRLGPLARASSTGGRAANRRSPLSL